MLLISARSPSKPVMLIFDLQTRKVLFIEIVFLGMYNLERQLWYWHLLMRHCPCNLLPEPTSPKHKYREKLWGHPVTSSMTSSPQKTFWGIIWDDLFISEVRLKLCLIFQNFQNGRHFELATNFSSEVIPEVEYTRKIAVSISDILSFWSTL